MLRKSLFPCLAMLLCFCFLSASVAQARPSWVSVAYSGFTLHKNADQTNPDAPGYYYAKIIATCTNNGNAIITGLSSRSMGFVAQAVEGGVQVGSAQGMIVIDTPATFEPVQPGETFTITYSVPVMSVEGVTLQQFNSAPYAKLRKYRLQHNFNVMTR